MSWVHPNDLHAEPDAVFDEDAPPIHVLPVRDLATGLVDAYQEDPVFTTRICTRLDPSARLLRQVREAWASKRLTRGTP